ncbi:MULTISPECIES: acetylornithine deacetylase [Pseudomonas]|jgi:acetylornithine deacetylase|uniref:Acetylornithine deacetylase n=1 Tax=Pseudomonas extremorientalis TaxID=169669 RepID=A0A1H0MMU7_9PSED|nr:MULTISPECIES: acetylornithine deacetylase [Pseudomonas]KAB0513459.1 acetylornithine deacetylase [Pseudomonas extremorientalis]OIN08668.1 acetylornithine deacetylase (ArgE) [Pseudomonas extremorientalis]PMV18103.1 acetylornithine deacetylase [Pseudomonas sp. FW305-3-2-15-C-TSA2]PMV20273.1 acetylornithine deacetylase [Pseudomonas sp. DP16D-L5]PMV33434.1 acetylornithine deacetylase [Pseudomonas sp. FW305-3-2-15-A-LB2]
MNSRDLLAQLVRFDTTSRESNLALIDFVRTYLQDHGVACELVYNAHKSKANLLATIGPAQVPGIVLSGHTDVVPVDGQRWRVAPFELTEQDGKLYGRGTADMKGYIACVLACVPALVQAPLRMPVHIALSYDEEVGCLGVRSLIERFHGQPVKPLLCVIGEPTELKPVLGHKGKLAMRCQVHGAACHSAYAPAGVNAIEYAARLVSEWVRLGETLKAPEHLDARFDPAFSTVQTGLISGGKALNIVPQDCSFDFEVRSLPAQDPWQVVQQLRDYAEYSLLPAMRAVSAQSAISISELSSYPGLATAPESQAAEWVAQFCGSQDFGTVAFGTEGGLFDQAGIPTVVCGPGSMEQGHKPDEFISLAQLQACDRMLARVLKFVSV